MDRANGAAGAAASRAERFEDEKRRIIDSCFSKTEADGSLLETYITHIRITEYSSYPSTPPPPQARTPDAEKPRIIVVAVRRSGRVRMHKSKENANGTFSIGKTWNLDDLSHIESFTGPQVSPSNREWAGDTGFVVTLGKPYFWQAQTDKEKKFFIASLIKIYAKYTAGKVPDLAGFDQKELDQVIGAGRRPAAAQQASTLPSASAASSVPAAPPPPSSASERFPKPAAAALRQAPNGTTGSPAASFDSAASRERPPGPRWTAQTNRSQDSFAARSDDGASIPPRSRNGITGPGAFGRFGDPRDISESPIQEMPPPLSPMGEKPPPERRRPPMDPSRPQDRDLVPPPLMSPGFRRDPSVPPPTRSTDRTSPKKDSAVPGALRDPDAPPPALVPLDTAVRAESPKPDPAARGGARAAPNASLPTTPAVETPPPMDAPPPAVPEEEMRPGLGPMIKAKRSKGDIAGALWKAASAATAFRPRPGGAGDRLRLAKTTKASDGPDGITSVVPAPPRPVSRDRRPQTPEVPRPADRNSNNVPEVKVTASDSVQPATGAESALKETKKEEPSEEEPRRAVVTGNDIKYLQSLGVDPGLLDGRSDEFGKWLDYFGWVPGEHMRSQGMEDIKADIERELNKAQAGGWLARFQEGDERVDAIQRGIDLAIAECEEMDNLLTLYAVELSTLSDDIAYIEAQGQGLQVQTANQKLLKKELESLLETCAITSDDLEALRLAPLETTRGLEDVESALVTLFKAMIKMDPTLGGNEALPVVDATMDSDRTSGLNSDYGKMWIVQEKKEMYLQENAFFMRRLIEFMARQFDEAYAETRRFLEGALSKRVDPSNYDAGRALLWRYSPLMLYARDADLENWNRLIQIYQDKSHPLYKSQVQNVVAAWRKNARKMTGDEAELLFTSQVEKQQEGVATTARKLTVKRSQTLARALRSPLSDSGGSGGGGGGGGGGESAEKPGSDARSYPYEVFGSVLDDLLPLVEMEQNFIIDFFHATTLEQMDFPDAVAACPPRDRRGGDLRRHRLMEPDRDLARRVTRSMEVIFTFLEPELQRLVEWAIGQDALQGVGVLAMLEKKLSDMSQSNQEFLNTLLQKLHGLLEGRFRKFVDEQMRAIEETKVKINKRRGVISFVRVFPAFMAAIEGMLAGMDRSLALRRTVDREYDRILKSMFDSLMVIAREHPAAAATSGAADPEDKEALNFHILLIENMNHFIEETDTRGLEVLEEWREQASSEYDEHMRLYVNAVTRRPLGKLLDHLENMEAQLQAGKSAAAIAAQPSNSKATFNKVLSYHDAKEVRKGIEALRKRVEKHFGDADDAALSRGLVAKATRECERFYNDVESRIGRLTTDVYGGEVAFEWPRADVKAAFR